MVGIHGMGHGGEPRDWEPSSASKDQATELSLHRLVHSPSVFAACPAQPRAE